MLEFWTFVVNSGNLKGEGKGGVARAPSAGDAFLRVSLRLPEGRKNEQKLPLSGVGLNSPLPNNDL